MAFFTIQRNGFAKIEQIVYQIVEDMVNHGFTVVYPSGFVPSARPTLTESSDVRIILQAGADVDPLSNSQPWRIAFKITGTDLCQICVATNVQLQDDGDIKYVVTSTPENTPPNVDGYAGEVGLGYKGSLQTSRDITDRLRSSAQYCFINRSLLWLGPGAYDNGPAFPLNYRLVCSPHGIFLGVYTSSWASSPDGDLLDGNKDKFFNWLVVQRPVDKNTGIPLITGKCPVFCVNSVGGLYWTFIVREADILHPTMPYSPIMHSDLGFRILNTNSQNCITEDKKYLISFPSNLTTPRYRYPQELDLIAFTGADIVPEGISVPLNVYNKNRTYISMPGNRNVYSATGMRILVPTDLG